MATRCAVYARYSSDQQRPESIADQVRHCRQEAARHADWVVLDDHVYADEARSGVSVEGRGGLQRLVQSALIKPRPLDLILIDDTSRLSRDVVDAVQHFRELRFHGVDLFFVNQGLHSGRDNAEFLLAIYGAMDSEYIRELGRKTHRGLEGQALQGFSAGGIAFGYRREPLYDQTATDRDGHRRRIGVRWVIDPTEADIVREIFRRYATGRGLATIALALNAEGLPCPRQAKGHPVAPRWRGSRLGRQLGACHSHERALPGPRDLESVQVAARARNAAATAGVPPGVRVGGAGPARPPDYRRSAVAAGSGTAHPCSRSVRSA
ncbi:MAG: hypothetical protein DMD91_29350 [Candidatus Rokuibacteriota bacterium]|nr:MAG: hypothetical protein DMD91_29350 [Candidatus Rokubacteria bacterium]